MWGRKIRGRGEETLRDRSDKDRDSRFPFLPDRESCQLDEWRMARRIRAILIHKAKHDGTCRSFTRSPCHVPWALGWVPMGVDPQLGRNCLLSSGHDLHLRAGAGLVSGSACGSKSWTKFWLCTPQDRRQHCAQCSSVVSTATCGPRTRTQ